MELKDSMEALIHHFKLYSKALVLIQVLLMHTLRCFF